MKQKNQKCTMDLAISLLPLTVVGLFLLAVRMFFASSITFWFLAWNLLLAWVPLLLVCWLQKRLQNTPWMSYSNGIITIAWLLFLPNTFYITTDIIHLQSRGEISIVFDAVMLLSYVISGLVLGFTSLYIMHKLLLARVSRRYAHMIIAIVLLLSSFAIYLGRYLRWNSWDVVVSPAGLLFDVSERVINPITHLETYAITGVFFVFLAACYIPIFQMMKYFGSVKK